MPPDFEFCTYHCIIYYAVIVAIVSLTLENITNRSGIEESNGTKVTCFRQSFDAARIVIKP